MQIPLNNSNNLADYDYLLHTIHRDDEDNQLYKIINLDIIDTDTDGEIIVGYRQHILQNNKLDPTDADIDVPYHINDLVRLSHSNKRIGLKAKIINGNRHLQCATTI
jgi:hypothetical protein